MRSTVLVMWCVALAVVYSSAQQRNVHVIDQADVSRTLAGSAEPNPFSELAQGDGFRVTVRRRTQLDVASQHDRRVEVYHILDGSATLVTGGRLRASKKVDDQGNSEGTGIDGGSARVVGKGAIVVLEAGLPHTFSKIDGSITYTTTWIFR